jgi:hypothetical protein
MQLLRRGWDRHIQPDAWAGGSSEHHRITCCRPRRYAFTRANAAETLAASFRLIVSDFFVGSGVLVIWTRLLKFGDVLVFGS